MLTIKVPGVELFDDAKQVFFNLPEVTLELEHSLISLSKWEAEYEKPFLGPDDKTIDETYGYVRAMTLTPDVPPEVYRRLSDENHQAINKYLEAKMSATWFTEKKPAGRSREIITSEIIYYWMLSLNIPMECQNWHLSRLFTLIKVCNQKNSANDKPKRSKAEMIAERNALNAKRKAEMQTSG